MGGIVEEGNRFKAQTVQEDVDHTRGGREKLLGQSGNDDPGEKMGQVDHGLGKSLKAGKSQLIEEQRQNDRCWKADHQVQEVQKQGVAQRIEEIEVAESFQEILKPVIVCQRHLPRALNDAVALKGDLDIGHGDVPKDNKISDGNGKHQIKGPVFAQVVDDAPGIDVGYTFHLLPSAPFYTTMVVYLNNILHFDKSQPHFLRWFGAFNPGKTRNSGVCSDREGRPQGGRDCTAQRWLAVCPRSAGSA